MAEIRRLPPETETLTVFVETRRDDGTSRDRDVETETTTQRLAVTCNNMVLHADR